MTERLTFNGGQVFTGREFQPTELHLEDGLVLSVGGPALRGARAIDVSGMLVIPGAIDAHVHGRDPGFPEKETFRTLTEAAAAGGVTAVLDMPNNLPSVDSVAAFQQKIAAVEDRAVVDYGLFAVIRSSTTPEMVEQLAAAGVIGFKAYLGYAWRLSTRQVLYVPRASLARDGGDLEPPPVYSTLEALAPAIGAAGLPLVVHCEDPALLRPEQAIAEYSDLLEARPAEAEAAAVARLGELAARGLCAVHIAHLSSGAGLQQSRGFRGPNFTAEVTPNHLWRSAADYPALGNLLKMFPPVRTAADRDALREGLLVGDISIVATDHAPHTDAEKLDRSLADAAPGSPGVQTLVTSTLELARELAEPARAVPWLTSNPAAIFGLGSQKGTFAPGSDGDVTILDPSVPTVVAPDEMRSRQKHSALEGLEFGFRVRAVYLRGEPTGRPGAGRLLRPSRKAG